MAMNQRIRASLPLFQKVLASDSLSSGRSTLQKISPNFITAERNYATAPAKSDKIKVSEEGNKSATLIITARIFSVIWNFDQVKNSGHECYRNQQGMESCYSYKIVLKDESIADSRFMLVKFAVSDTPEAPLVVATPMKVTSFSISTQQ